MEKTQHQVARAALLVMSAFAVSRALGFVRQMVFGIYFGTGPEMDAYVAALRVPDALFLVVAGGALGSAFIPLFAERLAHKDDEGAWRLASAISNLLLCILLPLSLIAMAFAPWMMRAVVAPAASWEIQERAAALMRVMLISPAIFGVSGIVMGALNAHQHFLLPAIAPIFYNLAMIGGAIWGGLTGRGTMGAAVGMVIGSVAHLLVQIPGLLRYRAHYVPTLGLRDPGVREVGMLMAPRVLGVAAVQINMVITTRLASGLGSGAISALEYAWRLMLLPQGIFAQAVGTAAFPTFAAQVARGELDAMRHTLSTMMRTLVALMLPATVGMIVLARPLIALVFERGAFSVSSTEDVSLALAFFALGLVGHSLIEILARAFYALHDTWTPAAAALAAMVLNLVLGLLLPSFFAGMAMAPHGGLALANALAALTEMGVLLLVLRRRVGDWNLGVALDRTVRPFLASVGMGGIVLLWLHFAPPNLLLQCLVGIAVGVLAYGLFAWLLQIDELRLAVAAVLHRR